MLCSFLLCSGSLVWRAAFFKFGPWMECKRAGPEREGSESYSDTEKPAKDTPRCKACFWIATPDCEICYELSVSLWLHRKGTSPNTCPPLKDGHFTRSRQTPFEGGWGNDDGTDYQTMEETFFIDVAGKKLSSTTIDLAGAASWFGSLCLAFGCTHIYIYIYVSSSLTLRP